MNLARFGLIQDPELGLVYVEAEAEIEELARAPASAKLSRVARRYSQGSFGAADWARVDLGLKAEYTALQALSAVQAATKKKPAGKKKTKKTTKGGDPDAAAEQRRKSIEKFGLIDFDEDIRKMDLETLRKHFGHGTGTIKKALFAANIIWQIYRLSKAGKPPSLVVNGGNVRSLWYYVKKVVQDHPRAFKIKKDLDGMFSKTLSKMVLAGLLSYKDLNISDDRESFRRLAPTYGNPHIILLGEKTAFLSKLIDVGLNYGITVQCSKGMPSLVMADTMLTEMLEAGYDITQEFIILAFTDWDPTGWSIGNTFARHLNSLGIKNLRVFNQYPEARFCLDVVNPQDLSSDFLMRARNSIKTKQQARASTKKWALATGGLYKRGGTNYAVSAEEHLELFDQALAEKIVPFLRQKPEVFTRLINLEYLTDTLGQYLLERILAPEKP